MDKNCKAFFNTKYNCNEIVLDDSLYCLKHTEFIEIRDKNRILEKNSYYEIYKEEDFYNRIYTTDD